MFLCVVVFGLFHGILLLPVLLALIGSHSEHDEEPFEDKEVFQSYLIISYPTYNKLVLPKSRFLQHVAPEQSTNPSKTLGSIVPMFARI